MGTRTDYEICVNPVFVDKSGPKYSRESANRMCLKMIDSENFFERKAKFMTNDAERATEKVETVIRDFSIALDRFMETEKNFVEAAKKASGSVRDAGERLSQGLSRVEKAANFDKLGQYVILLERAAAAMTTLAELEASGRLERIANSLK